MNESTKETVSSTALRPLVLPPNILDHFYLGGARIAALRGVDLPSPRRPEEWLAATNRRAGEGDTGLSRTADGELLRDLIAADPIGWLGSDAGPEGDNGILVKLLDPDQRLPVHVHPSRDFARSHLACPYGKTEAWYVLATEGEQPSVWLGWKTDVDPAEVSRAVDAQDSEWMLSRMHRLDVRPGDGILVPAGTAHAIGAGVFVTEVQEPTDFSIVMEWVVTTSTRDEAHLDLGLPLALQALNHEGWDDARLASLVAHTDPAQRSDAPIRLLPAEADPFFRLHRIAPVQSGVEVEAGFAVLVVLAGRGELESSSGSQHLERGQVLAVPSAFGDWTATGTDLTVAVARPGVGWPEELQA